MKRGSFFALFFLLILCPLKALPWGQTGHRVIGELGQLHLDGQTQVVCDILLKGMTLSDEANFLDEERDNPDFANVTPLHFINVGDQDKNYEDSSKDPRGDLVQAITVVFNYLKSGNPDDLKPLPALAKLVTDKGKAVIFLDHLVGDIHQPLHVGKTSDLGGNKVKVNYMWHNTNLHSVWDEAMIDGTRLSFSEYSKYLERILKNVTPEQKKAWENTDFVSWADESLSIMKNVVYVFPDAQPPVVPGQPPPLPVLSYRYESAVKANLEQQLLKAGVRLAYLLNLALGPDSNNLPANLPIAK